MPPRDRTKARVAPRQRRALVSRDAILTAAEELLRDDGVAAATTNRIAARAGVNVALLYRYFAGKEAIVGALIERVAAETLVAVRGALADHAAAPLPIAMRALLEALVATPRDPALHQQLFEHVDVTRRRATVQALRDTIAAVFADELERRRGELRPLPDLEATRFVVQHAVEAATHAAAFYRPDGLAMARVLDALTELITRSLVAVRD